MNATDLLRYWAYVVNFARLYVDREDAEDAAQEAMIAAWRQWDQTEQRCSLRAWLCSVARHKALNIQRHQRSLDRLACLQMGPGMATDDYRDPYDVERMRAAMGRVSSSHVALLLANADGWTAPELAHLLGITPKAAKRRLERAREKLRRNYAGL